MPRLDFRTKRTNFPDGTGRRSENEVVSFDSKVLRAGVAINGFKMDYVHSDHHINIVEADVDFKSIAGNNVNYTVQFNYADQNFADPYRGYVQTLVIAEVE